MLALTHRNSLLDLAHDFLRNDPWAFQSTAGFPIDVHEEEAKIVVEAELPGIEAKNIEVVVHNGVLTIKGKKNYEKKSGRDYFRAERYFGSFSRSFVLPTAVDAERIEAKSLDGILTVTLPKQEKVLPKKIKVLTE